MYVYVYPHATIALRIASRHVATAVCSTMASIDGRGGTSSVGLVGRNGGDRAM